MKRLMTTLLFVLLCGTGLCLADGVTVSGAVTFDNPYSAGQVVEGSASGTVKLLQNGEIKYSGTVASAYNSELGKGVSSYSIPDVAAGTYTLSFEGEGYGSILVYEEPDVVVASENLTKDFKANIDNTRGKMSISVQTGEWNGYYYDNSRYLPGATVTCLPSGDGQQLLTATAQGSYATAEFIVPVGDDMTYTITAKHETCIDTTFVREFSANIYLYMREKPLPTVNISGKVTMNGETLNTLGEDMKIGLKTVKAKIVTSEVTNGQYAFADVPVGASTLFVYDPDGGYDYSINSTLSKNFSIKNPENGSITLTESETGLTQDIEIERIAVNVTGKVEGVKGTVTVYLMDGDTRKNEVRSNAVGEFIFQGVTPGTYTLVASAFGYEQKNTPTVTVTLAGDVTADNIVMEGKETEFTFQNTYFSASNPYTGTWPLLTGATIELWSVDEEGNAKEKLAETTAGTAEQYAAWSLKVTGKMGTTYLIRIKHPDIEDCETIITADQGTINVYPTITFKYDGPELLPMENFESEWNTTKDSLILSWRWPDALKDLNTYGIELIQLYKKQTETAGNGSLVKYWSAPYDQATGKSVFAFDSLPVSIMDTVQDGNQYTYSFTIRYNKPYNGTLEPNFIVDLRKKHTLAYEVNDPAMGSIKSENEPGADYLKNDYISLVAVPNDGYRFVEWQTSWSLEAGAPIDPVYTTTNDTLSFYMPDRDVKKTAVFKKNRFVITLNVNPENAGTVSGGGTYEGDTTVTIKAVANDGYRFKVWMEGNEEVTTKAEYKFKPEDDRTLTAVFEETKYVLGLGVNHAEWGKVEGAGEFAAGTEVTVKATANEGYKFVAWHEGEAEVSKEASYTFKMQAKDITLTAVFENAAQQYTVTLEANNTEWGKVEGTGEFAEGTTVTIKATPNENYHFVAWKDGETEVSTTAVYSFKLEKDITLTAVFAEGSANEEREATRWQIYAENGTIVINGLSGDRYSVYDLNGRLAGQAFCTGAEIRIDVAPNKLYIVRRISAAGLFGAKKIVVH